MGQILGADMEREQPGRGQVAAGVVAVNAGYRLPFRRRNRSSATISASCQGWTAAAGWGEAGVARRFTVLVTCRH
jgi:hypothetical protein